jgi:hypothetical protein
MELRWNEKVVPVHIRHWGEFLGRERDLYGIFYKQSVFELEQLIERQRNYQIYLSSFFLGSPNDCASYTWLIESLTKEKELDHWVKAELVAHGVAFHANVWFTRVPSDKVDRQNGAPSYFVKLGIKLDESWFENRTEVDASI